MIRKNWEGVQMDFSCAACEDVIAKHLNVVHTYTISAHPKQLFATMRIASSWNVGNDLRPVSVQYVVKTAHDLEGDYHWRINDGETEVEVKGP